LTEAFQNANIGMVLKLLETTKSDKSESSIDMAVPGLISRSTLSDLLKRGPEEVKPSI
jgi:hypothetical protein